MIKQDNEIKKHILNKRNIIITGTNKTTNLDFLNKLLVIIDQEDRIIYIGDHKTEGLVYNTMKYNHDYIEPEHLEYLLKLRPDRVIIDGASDDEFTFLIEAANCGWNFIATIKHDEKVSSIMNKGLQSDNPSLKVEHSDPIVIDIDSGEMIDSIEYY